MIVRFRVIERLGVFAVRDFTCQDHNRQVCNLDDAPEAGACLAFEAVKDQQSEGLHRPG
jgi:hypothetical protein